MTNCLIWRVYNGRRMAEGEGESCIYFYFPIIKHGDALLLKYERCYVSFTCIDISILRGCKYWIC